MGGGTCKISATMRIDFDSVECSSAFTLAREAGGSVHAVAGGLELVTLPDVLFLPHALDRSQSICLVQQHLVPVEAVLDCWNVGFFKDRRRALNPIPYSAEFEAVAHDAEVCILGNLFSRNFGHWTEELLKVAVLEQAGVGCTYVIPSMAGFAQASLAFLGIEMHRIATVDVPTVFSRALFTTAVNHQNVAQHPRALSSLRDLVDRKLGGATGPHRRIWLERREMLRNAGVVANPEEVGKLISRHGFEVIDMATLSIRDQLATAAGAQVIAGPHGAQFVHAQFMPRQSTVIECFSPIHVNPSILQICRALGHSYHQVVARSHLISPYALGRDCAVDCEHLELILDSLPG